MGNFDPIFDELAADTEMAGNFAGPTARRHQPAQRCVRN